MTNPLFESFAMDQVSEDEQGALNSILVFTFEAGWAVGPFISGVIQENYGYDPLFIATAVLYGIGISLIWFFFRDSETSPQDEPTLQLAKL